jgi:hypothetical protein
VSSPHWSRKGTKYSHKMHIALGVKVSYDCTTKTEIELCPILLQPPNIYCEKNHPKEAHYFVQAGRQT